MPSSNIRNSIFELLDRLAPQSERYVPFFERHYRILLKSALLVFAISGVGAFWQFLIGAPRPPLWFEFLLALPAAVVTWFWIGAIPVWVNQRDRPKPRKQHDSHATPEQQRKLARRATRQSRR